MPGLIFRTALYHLAQVRRPIFDGNTIYSTISILLYSVIVHIVFILFAWIVEAASTRCFPITLPHLVEIDKYLKVVWNNSPPDGIISFSLGNPLVVVIYFALLSVMAWVLARVLRLVLERMPKAGRLLYGPLGHLLSGTQVPLITSFVLTKIQHENRRVMYQGIVREISLGDGNNISHIVLEYPEKYYFEMEERIPSTTKIEAKEISSTLGLLFIDGEEVENIHFQSFNFEQ